MRELKWYAAALGEVRDLEVLQQHLLSDLAELPAQNSSSGRCTARLSQTLDADLARARRKLATVMRSKRYLALLNELHAWSIDAPFTSRPETGQAPDSVRDQDRAQVPQAATGRRSAR